ncbi:synapse-associated protein 47kD isoform X4 [Musca autumnalis]|uniref:synapse-associated protein 47kD isoform X4 n=1 Tax=Musca autumnalis TaxID=221902 RepID=UPI003CEB556F
MFSNITNQFTSLVGAVKGGNEEDVPASEGAPAAAAAAPAAQQDPAAATAEGAEGEEGKSPKSFVDSLFKETTGWLGSAKGWLGSASIPSMPAMPSMPTMAMPSMPAMPSIPSIPGLRKGGEEGAEGVAATGVENPAAATGGEDDDKSSATEGADSLAASGDEAQLGEDGQIGQVTTKVTQQAKHFGSFLSSAFTEAGSKLKETVKKNPIMESFNKEQEAFIKGQAGGNGPAVAPWVGLTNEAKIKEEIMGLSQDRRNFVRAPPAGIDFEFNYDTAYPTAQAIMEEDKNLETMRFELVPKIITEENFWRNYFYRVSLIIQAAELGTLGEDGVAQASSGEDAIVSKSQETSGTSVDQSKLKSQQTASSSSAITSNTTPTKNDATKSVSSASTLITQEPQRAMKRLESTSESEFVSDTFQTTVDSEDLEEIKNGMRKLGIDSMTQQLQNASSASSSNALSNDEEQWEKDLEAELKDFEVVDNGSKKVAGGAGSGGGAVEDEGDYDDDLPTISRTRNANNDWEEEYADLIEDTDDLKTLKDLKRVMLGYQRDQSFFSLF